jgi:hypothetical protein
MENVWFRECGTGRRFIIKIGPGADLVRVLLDFAQSQDLPFASLVSAVGSVRNVEIASILAGAHLPMTEARFKVTRLEGPLELMGLEGNIAPGDDQRLAGQFHLVASKSNGDVVGGRLVAAEVFTPCEIVLAEYLVAGITRYASATAGVDTIFIADQAQGGQPCKP